MTWTVEELVRRYLMEAVGNRDIGVLTQVFAEEAIVHGPAPGSRSTGRAEDSLADYPAGGSVTVLDLVVENGRVAARWMMTAPDSGPEEHEGERTLRALSVFWIEGERIREAWTGVRAGELWVN